MPNTTAETAINMDKNYDLFIEAIKNCKLFLLELMNFVELGVYLDEGNEVLLDEPLQDDLTRSHNSICNEYEVMSSILHKNEQESKKLKNHYEERLKDMSEERDQLMRDVLESKFKIENQRSSIERLKAKNLESDESLKVLKKECEEKSLLLSIKEKEIRQYLQQYTSLNDEIFEVKKRETEFMEQLQNVKSFNEKMFLLNGKIKKALDIKCEKNLKVMNELLETKSEKVKYQSQNKEHVQAIAQKSLQIAEIEKRFLEKELLWREKFENRSILEESLTKVESALQEAIRNNEKKEKEREELVQMNSRLAEKLKNYEYLASKKELDKFLEKEEIETELTAKLIEAKTQLSIKNAEFDLVEKELKELKENLNLKTIELEQYQKLYTENKSEHDSLVEVIEKLQKQNTLLDNDNNYLKKCSKELQEGYNSLREENKNLLSSKTQCVEELFRIQIILDDEKKERSKLQEKLDTLVINESLPNDCQATQDQLQRKDCFKNEPANVQMEIDTKDMEDEVFDVIEPTKKICSKCEKPAFGLMISCASCVKKFHATCLPSSVHMSSYQCESCSSGSITCLKRKSSLVDGSKKRMKRVSFSIAE